MIKHGNFKYYYPSSGAREQYLAEWHLRHRLDLIPELFDYDAFHKHMGLIPIGSWFVPIIVNPGIVAWGLENFPENTKLDIAKNELSWVPYYPWYKTGEPRPKWRQKNYSSNNGDPQ